ncbi:MAG: CoA-binding protein [Gammaproteobacteria bacterium]|nr:MAG: CoA-binding protein [Gammaproteobacteria bacterium]RTZ76439.1 MAG: CoA-binding protein [Gammaproteobacteria bacterium]
MDPSQHHVAVLGATPKPERYANQAVRLLLEKGYRVTPIHPKIASIEGLAVAPSVEQITDPVDTLTLYVGPARLEPMIDSLVALKPGRVIFNPGTESPALQQALDTAGIPWEEACTLVLLRTGQFLK